MAKEKAKKVIKPNIDIVSVVLDEIQAQYDPNTGKIVFVGRLRGDIVSESGEKYSVSGKFGAKIKSKDTTVVKHPVA